MKGSAGDSLEVQVHEWHGWTSLWPHQSCASSVSVVVPSKSCVLRGSGDTVCGLCALVSGSHGKGYYTTAASVFALAPGARHDPRADVLCRLRWSLEVTKYQAFFFLQWVEDCLPFPELEGKDTLHWSLMMDEFLYLSYFRCMGCGGWFGFGCCLWPCEDPALAVC